MCLILDAQPNVYLDPTWLAYARDDNPHGWGVVASHAGKIRVTRGFSLHGLLRAVERAGEQSHRTIHLRWATHGEVNLENVHPIRVDVRNGRDRGVYWLVHNGIVQVPTGEGRSDTWHYARSRVAPTIARLGLDRAVTELASDTRTLGWSRIVLVAPGGSRIHWGDRGVDLAPGLWASNDQPLDWPGSPWGAAKSRWGRSAPFDSFDSFDDPFDRSTARPLDPFDPFDPLGY